LKAYFSLFLRHLEFRKFVENAERQLFALFKSIDKDGNGKLDKLELQTAFKNAGLTLSNRRLSEFFDDMDINNDGYVTFDEWRSVFYSKLSPNACFPSFLFA
jgi:solute carrier family 25 phosphate transporter 23/24/25/41